MSKSKPGSYGGTYGGDAVSCAAAVANVQIIREEKLAENSARLGDCLLARLEALQAEYPVIGDVRGVWLMVGTEFTTADGKPDTQTAKTIRLERLERGMVILSCGPGLNFRTLRNLIT